MMNAYFERYPIYLKDTRILWKQMLGAFAVQAVLMVGIQYLFILEQEWYGSQHYSPIHDWFPKVQIVITALIALIAAAYYWAEERTGEHDLFLRRLPISCWRMWREKLVAGITIVLAAISVQVIWFLLFLLLGVRLWDASDPVFFYVVAFGLVAYLYGIPLSYYLMQSVAVIFLGLFLTFFTLVPGFILLREIIKNTHYLNDFLILLPFLLIFIGICYLFFSFSYRTLHSNASRFFVIWGKQSRELIVYNSLVLLLFTFTIYLMLGTITGVKIGSDGPIPMLMIITAGILSAALGIASYSQQEKDGMDSIFYHHPVPLGHLFWSKFLYGLVVACLPAFVITFFLAYMFSHYGGNLPQNLINQHPLSALLTIFMLALIPYCCGVLFTHAIPNTIYAILETVPAVLLTIFLYMQIQFLSVKPMFDILKQWHGGHFVAVGIIPWLPILFLAALITAGRLAACDRRVLTGTTLYRQLHVWRLYFFVCSIVFLLSYVGWKDLFYLVTSIDIGMG